MPFDDDDGGDGEDSGGRVHSNAMEGEVDVVEADFVLVVIDDANESGCLDYWPSYCANG